MASDIELEIAMSMVQLTGVTLPILLGIIRFYLKDPSVFEETIEDHEGLAEGATFSDFFILIVYTLLASHIFAASFIAANVHLNVALAVQTYGAFLVFITFSALLTLGEDIIEDIKQVLIRTAIGLTIIFVCLIILAFLFGYIVSAIILGLTLLTLAIPTLICYLYYWRGSESDPDPSDEQEERTPAPERDES